MENSILFFRGEAISCEDLFESKPEFVIVDKYEFIKKEVDKLLALDEDWDGQGGLPISIEVGENVKKLFTVINCIDGISDIFPNPHGTITIEWVNNRKEKLALEVGSNSYSYFIKYSDKKPKLVDGKNILEHTESLTNDLDDLFSEEILNFILS